LGSFQPAELLKFGVLVFLARFMAQRISVHKLNDWKESIWPILTVSMVILFIVIVVQKDMGTGIAIFSIIASMLFVAGVNRQIGLRLLIGALIAGVLLIVTAPHRVERMLTFLRGDQTSSQSALDEDYQIRHAKIAIGSGGLMGVGIGNSVEATGYLPEALNDSLFAILGETFGFIGLTLIMLVFLMLLMRFLRIVDRSVDTWMKLVAAGAFGWLASHMILNIASMIGIFPLTGITLPLLSFGGTSMLFISAVVGMMFQISKYTRFGKIKVEESASADTSSGRRIRRPRHTNHSGT
jgi:cell division protein FtsW